MTVFIYICFNQNQIIAKKVERNKQKLNAQFGNVQTGKVWKRAELILGNVAVEASGTHTRV
jgi:hypothetical protein